MKLSTRPADRNGGEQTRSSRSILILLTGFLTGGITGFLIGGVNRGKGGMSVVLARTRRSAVRTESPLVSLAQRLDSGNISLTECPPTPPLDTFVERIEIGDILEKEGFKRGAEVGVQLGWNARELLLRWCSAEYFALVDLWAHQENYDDLANVDDAEQERYMIQAKKNLRKWNDKLEFFRMKSTEAAAQMEDESLDFVYVDARHDYCGVTEDLEAYWPKVRRGGVMAGHDFLYALDVAPKQDWSLCANGTVHEGAVRGAVEDFARARNLQLVVGHAEEWPSWMVRKPLC